jgi:hypothetical protein
VTFVSVTQSFNSTTSMGRPTLNILLSFAQFEREVIGERIRDKVAASRRKGIWMGGPVPLGHDVKDRKLVVNPAEAAAVQTIFRLFARSSSTAQLIDELHTRAILTKKRKPFDVNPRAKVTHLWREPSEPSPVHLFIVHLLVHFERSGCKFSYGLRGAMRESLHPPNMPKMFSNVDLRGRFPMPSTGTTPAFRASARPPRWRRVAGFRAVAAGRSRAR